jgi:xanthosine utilization system XapX-like protein
MRHDKPLPRLLSLLALAAFTLAVIFIVCALGAMRSLRGGEPAGMMFLALWLAAPYMVLNWIAHRCRARPPASIAALVCAGLTIGFLIFALAPMIGAPPNKWAGLAVMYIGLYQWIGVVLATIAVPMAWVRSAPHPENRCTSCGYDLRGLRGPRCPECGRAFRLLARPP